MTLDTVVLIRAGKSLHEHFSLGPACYRNEDKSGKNETEVRVRAYREQGRQTVWY